MIIVNNLTKVYKSKEIKKHHNLVLKNLSFTLPDTGFVFIVGKSGSGKSTLLNMIGGLDDYTSGEIIVDGNNFSNFNAKDFMKYRSSYLGFVFQQYNLIDEMTVRQNIELTLDISGVEGDVVSTALEQVEMLGYEDRYPYELSGGQRQRVAIARALAKNPKLILGDEPTGNLDSKTTTLVMDLLKKISQEKLVVIVSHDIESAHKYADRIIELSDGIIISDTVRRDNYKNEFTVNDEEIILPYQKDLTEEESKKFYYALKINRFKRIRQLDNGIYNTNNEVFSNKTTKLISHEISKINIFKLSKVFLGKRFISSLGIILLTTLIFVVISITQSMIQFDPNIYDVSEKETVVLKKYDQTPFKDTVYSSLIYDISDSEFEKIDFEKADGNIYKLYNYTCCSEKDKIYSGIIRDNERNYRHFYCIESQGTLNCTMDYLNEIYGNGSEVKVLAGKITDDDCKLIITDYVADSLIYHSNTLETYDDIINWKNEQFDFVISAIIDTNYEEKYAELIDIYQSNNDYAMSYKIVCNTDLFKEFLEDVITFLGITYNINPNFEEDLKTNKVNSRFNLNGVSISGNGKENDFAGNKAISIFNTNKDNPLKEGEVILGYSEYNKLFKTSYDEKTYVDFIPHDITITYYVDQDKSKGVLYTETYTIVSLIRGDGMRLCSSDFSKLYGESVKNYGLYFDRVSNVEELTYLASEYNMHVNNIDQDNILVINKFINSFNPFLRLIFIMLVVFESIYLIGFGVNTIRQNLFEIGVIKSLGGRTKDIGIIFIVNVLLTGVGVCISCVILSPIMIKVVNNMLVSSFARVLNLTIYSLRIVKVIPVLMAFNLFVILLLSFVSSVISMILLYKVKPIEIIKSKE